MTQVKMRLETEEEYEARIKESIDAELAETIDKPEFKAGLEFLQKGINKIALIDKKFADELVGFINSAMEKKTTYVYLAYQEALKHEGSVKEVPV